jgi:hypothetical protein
MTLFVTNGDLLSDLGNGTVGVYFLDDSGAEICGGSASFTGSNFQISANGDDATSADKDGFSSGETIIWKFEDNSGNQYNLNITSIAPNSSGPADVYNLNGLSFVTGISYTAVSCAVDPEGCTDSNYVEYNPNASIDDGSCLTIAIEGCTDSDYLEYNSSANVGDGSCVTLSVEGCTDPSYLEYDSGANVDDGSCSSIAIEGCTDSNATNYDANANTADGSCEYDLLGVGCQVSFESVNTGSNLTLFFIPDATLGAPLSIGDQVGVFFIDSNGSAVCAGSSLWNGGQFQITAYGDDLLTDNLDGLSDGSPLIILAQSGDNVYNVSASYQSEDMSTYSTNGLSYVTSLDFQLACTVQYLGCSDPSACNYDSTANTDDGSCIYPGDIYDCDNGCVNDDDVDGVCDEFEVVGCQDPSASNYDPDATDEGSCISWEQAYESCSQLGGDNGIVQADVDAAYAAGAAQAAEAFAFELADTISAMQARYDALNTYWQDLYNSVTPDDGVSQADVDAAVAAAQSIAADEISALEAQIDAILLSNGDDGITQFDVDAAVAAAEAVAANQIAELESQVLGSYVSGYSEGAASVTPEDGIGQADVDAAFDTGVASVDITVDNQDAYDAGVASIDITVDNQDAYDAGAASVDVSSNDQDVYDSGYDNGYSVGYDVGVNSVDITSDNSSIADLSYLSGYTDGAGSVTPEDGIGQADLDALQLLLDEALANSGGSCEPIYIDLLEGWNIMGYTLPNPQDVAATLSSIVSDVQIVKNNAAAVYWPEYSFNGIGDFIPGQGYQIRMINALNSYTFPDVGNQRIELSPTVPQWVQDLPILNHPNDIRSLVRVVNMLGQQVDPNTQFKGEIILYLYNDGTTEKRMVE